ncbi:MAG: hypothetical protein CM1200mP10_31840 [Candidatus Neomarinimicrobiota bacterium]|nr:MAG: hypothetical protein CM1200mP10_31840 [Candidatus Neomarinimicrobiota bacterium]
MLAGVNDDIADADRLMVLIGDLPCKLNLIPYNEIDGFSTVQVKRKLNDL